MSHVSLDKFVLQSQRFSLWNREFVGFGHGKTPSLLETCFILNTVKFPRFSKLPQLLFHLLVTPQQ